MTWHVISLAVSCTTLFFILWTFRTLVDIRTRFLVLAIWGRYVLAAFHEFTYPPIAAGLSINALFSIFVALASVALVPLRAFLQLQLLPLALLIFIIALSALLNSEFGGLASDLTKWLYFIGISLLLYYSCVKYNPDLVLRALFAAALTPLILQVLSIVLNHPNVGQDGSTSYIGGYYHEGAFSTVLFTILCLGALIRWRYAVVALLLVPLCIAGILLANYRTTMVATLPLVAVLVGGTLLRWTPPTFRPISAAYVLAGGIGVLGIIVLFMPPRFLDILVVLQNASDLMKPPGLFSVEERQLFNGRIFLWSEYISTWWEASLPVHILGFGPEAWEGVQRLYAHNTFVSYVYEFGLVGLAALILFFATQVAVATQATPRFLAAKLTAGLAGFIILNLATMPLWTIEGLILLAVLCGVSWASFDGPEATQRAVVSPEEAKRPIGARWQSEPALSTDQGARRTGAMYPRAASLEEAKPPSTTRSRPDPAVSRGRLASQRNS